MPNFVTIIAVLMLSTISLFTQASVSINNYTKSAQSIENVFNLYQGSTRKLSPKYKEKAIVLSKDLWKLAPALFQLNLNTNHPRVKNEISRLLKNSSFITRTSIRARPYFNHILKRLIRRGLPTELAMLPFIESGYNPRATSSAKAQGTWQFIPSTAKHFGLKNTHWYDARGDILESTEAALTYLAQLNRRFKGDWLLTLAAYNCGATCVRNAQLKNKRQGKKTNFWALSLPKETRRYVPKFLAMNKIIRDAKRYAINLKPLANKRVFTVVALPGQMTLKTASALAGVTKKRIAQLNPGLKRQKTDPAGPHQLLIPIENAAHFRQKLQQIANTRPLKKINSASKANTDIAIKQNTDPKKTSNMLAYQSYQQQAKPAAKHLVSASKAVNRSLKKNTHNVILKPQATKVNFAVDTRKKKLKAGKKRIVYKIKSGDSIQSITKKFKIRKTDIARWNKSYSSQSYLRPNQTLIIYIKVNIKT